MTLVDKAAELRRLHTDPDLLVVVNVWDAVTAKVVADQPGCRALATASHSIAASLGYPDGERIPVDLMIDMVGRIAAAVELPVSADLEAGYGDAGETVRRAIGVGVVGANIEDQMRPLPDAVAAVDAAVAAADKEGVPFALNARTDAFLRAGDRDRGDVLADAIERGRAFVDAGATCVFVPGKFDEPTVTALVEGIGERLVSVIAVPGLTPPASGSRSWGSPGSRSGRGRSAPCSRTSPTSPQACWPADRCRTAYARSTDHSGPTGMGNATRRAVLNRLLNRSCESTDSSARWGMPCARRYRRESPLRGTPSSTRPGVHEHSRRPWAPPVGEETGTT